MTRTGRFYACDAAPPSGATSAREPVRTRTRAPARVAVPALVRAVVVGVVLLSAALQPASALAGDIEVDAHVDRTVASLNDQITLTIEARGTMRQVGTPRLPADLSEDFSIYSAGTSTNMSWVNGAMSSSRSWTYRLLPKRVGTFTVGSAEIEFDGDVYTTEPIEVEVVEGEVQRARPSEREERSSSGVSSGGRDVFITTSVDKKRAYVGEQVTLSFKFYRRVDLWDQPRYQAPDLTGFWVEDIEGQEDYYEIVDGIRYVVVEMKTALFGTSAGTATVGPATLTYRAQSAPVTFFPRAGPQRTLTTDPIEVEILPLPAEGRPADFRGAVGSYTFKASLESREVDQWKPVTLRISVAGRGNIRTVPDPELPELPEFKVYESGTSTSTSTKNGIVSGRKTYEYVLVPQTAGEKTVPPIDLSFFDPERGAYRTVETPELTLSVAPAEAEEGGGPDLPARAAIARLGRDIRYIHEPDRLVAARAPLHQRRSFLLLQLVPLAALGCAVALRRRRDRFAAEEGLEGFVRAPGRARRELKGARQALARGDSAAVCSSVSKAVTDFIADRFRVGARGMTLHELGSVLAAAGASEQTVERIRDLLSQCDLGRFAGDVGAVEGERLISEAEACVAELERLSAKRRRR